jgi:hypothetical protein
MKPRSRAYHSFLNLVFIGSKVGKHVNPGEERMAINPQELNLYYGIVAGFLATVLIASVLNKFGNMMFRRGVAKPFYVGKHRLHHRDFLLFVFPLGYSSVVSLFLAGYVRVEWGIIWNGLVGTLVVALACMVFDLTMDYLRKGFRGGLLKHELIYLTIPAFVFSDFLRLVV